MNRPQPVLVVSVDPKTDYAFFIRALGGQVFDLDHRPGDGWTLNPMHAGEPAGEPNSAGDPR